MKVLKGVMCFILSAEWLGDDAADAVERAADPLNRAAIDSEPFGNDAHRAFQESPGPYGFFFPGRGLSEATRGGFPHP